MVLFPLAFYYKQQSHPKTLFQYYLEIASGKNCSIPKPFKHRQVFVGAAPHFQELKSVLVKVQLKKQNQLNHIKIPQETKSKTIATYEYGHKPLTKYWHSKSKHIYK